MKRPSLSQRSAGLLLPLFSLPGKNSVGDLGPAAYEFVDFLRAANQRWWQMLPFHPAGEGDSPYRSPSAFAGSLLYISAEGLVKAGWLDARDLQATAPPRSRRVDYVRAGRYKEMLLRRAFENFRVRSTAAGRAALTAFVQREAFWLTDYVLFAALRRAFHNRPWTEWPRALRKRHAAALAQARQERAAEIAFRQFVQWQFEVQWNALKDYAARRGIGLIGDVPIFVSPDSSDVWANPEIFRLKPSGVPAVVAGVPPDYFTKTGQLWGNPTYRWEALARKNYRWWIERLRRAFQCFDVIRLDHFIGFVRAYEVPAGAPTAEHGHYRPGPRHDFFRAVYRALPRIKFIGEDLGAVTPEVLDLRGRWKIPGMHVLQFEWENPLIEKNTVVYTGTHDNDTTRGWLIHLPRGMQRQVTRRWKATRRVPVSWKLVEAAHASPAFTAIIPVQDLLDLDSASRVNLPGSPLGNWRWRLLHGQLTPTVRRRLRALTRAAAR